MVPENSWDTFFLLLVFPSDKEWKNILFIFIYYLLEVSYASPGKLTFGKE